MSKEAKTEGHHSCEALSERVTILLLRVTVVLIQTVPYLVYSCLPGSPGSMAAGTRQKLHWYTLRSGPRQENSQGADITFLVNIHFPHDGGSQLGAILLPLGDILGCATSQEGRCYWCLIEERPEMLLAILCTDRSAPTAK